MDPNKKKSADQSSPEPTSAVTPISVVKSGFPIVGIGASAGGLAAFEAFFSAMPTDIDPGMAFILVQHLAPDHKSILVDLIRRFTSMQVFEVEDGMEVHPGCTYIIPLISSSDPWPRISTSALSALFFQAPVVMAPWGCEPLRVKAAWLWHRAQHPPSTTVCRVVR